MIELSFYSEKHGTRAKARVHHDKMMLRKKQVKRLERDLREPVDVCKITDLDGNTYVPLRNHETGDVAVGR